jgi:hypothetical protein
MTHLPLIASVVSSCHRWWFSLVSLDLFHRDLFDDTCSVVIEILVCLQDLFLFLFLISSHYNLRRERRERKEKNFEIKIKFWLQHHYYHKKYLNKTNLTPLIKVTNGDSSESRLLSKINEPPIIFRWQV